MDAEHIELDTLRECKVSPQVLLKLVDADLLRTEDDHFLLDLRPVHFCTGLRKETLHLLKLLHA